MATQIFYPHALRLDSSVDVMRFDSIAFDPQYQMITHMGGADPYPCFVGASSADPQISFSTPSIWNILSVCTEANVIADLSGSGNEAILYYRKGKPKAFRMPITDTVHIGVKLVESAILAWNTLSAREDQDAVIAAVLRTARKNIITPPWVNQGEIKVPASVCDDLFALGPVIYNGNLIGSIHQVEWSNNLRPYARRTSLSPIDPDWQSFHDMAPVITCTLNDLNEFDQQATIKDIYGGEEMSELRIYLRKRSRLGSYVADNVAEHIELVCFGGWRAGTGISGSEPADMTLEFHLSAAVNASGVVQGTDTLFSRALKKIPQAGVAPVLADFPSQALTTGEMAFLSPDLGGGGIPTSYEEFTGDLPAGVELNTTSGLMSGVVTAGAGTVNVTIRASNGFGNSDKATEWVISAP